MNTTTEHIKKKQKEYYGAFGDDKEINAISKTDTNIIRELAEILKKHGNTRVEAIMSDYKKVPDFQIEESLLELNTEMGSGENHNDGLFGELVEEAKKPKKITFNNLIQSRYCINDIFSFSILNDEEYPSILLNETPKDAKKISLVSNIVLQYRNEQEMEEDVLKLDELF